MSSRQITWQSEEKKREKVDSSSTGTVLGATWKHIPCLYMVGVYTYMNGVYTPFMYVYVLYRKTLAVYTDSVTGRFFLARNSYFVFGSGALRRWWIHQRRKDRHYLVRKLNLLLLLLVHMNKNIVSLNLWLHKMRRNVTKKMLSWKLRWRQLDLLRAKQS